MRKIIGLTGPFAAGKGFIAELLKKREFLYFSLSDILREELTKRNLPITRENLISLGNQLRQEHGEAVLANLLANKIKDIKESVVIDNIRNPKEVDALRQLDTFSLIAVDSYPNLRYKRLLARAKESDPKSLDELRELDKKDLEIGIYDCMEKADHILYNVNKTADDLNKELDHIVEAKRPSKDEYYFSIALAVAQRGTCLRRRFGAIIVKNDQIISTGYVGAPRGIPNCIDIKRCLRQEQNVPRGTRYELCRSVHAEENAMLHASREQMLGSTIFIAGQDLEKPGKPIIKAHPCTLCQRKIINSGIKRIITFDEKGEIHEFLTRDWIDESIKDPFKHFSQPGYK
jgi:dCMP deaminase